MSAMGIKPWYVEPHTDEWYRLEEAALERARELLHEQDGHIRDALWHLKQQLRADLPEDAGRSEYDRCRDYARAMVRHVEQCWATAILR